MPKPNPKTEPAVGPQPVGPEHFRRLKWDERVRRGDYVEDDQQGFKLWTGLVGFQADTFLKTIYRREKTSP